MDVMSCQVDLAQSCGVEIIYGLIAGSKRFSVDSALTRERTEGRCGGLSVERADPGGRSCPKLSIL
jgi:hypothetical protein